MHAGTILGLGLGLASTVLISLSYLREHDAAAGLPALSLRRPLHSAKLLVSSRPWLMGFAMESGGFGLYVAALALAPLALVQSVAAGGVGILAIATARLAHRRLTRRESAGAGLAVAGLVLLAVSLSGGQAADARGSLVAIVSWLGATVGAAILIFISGRAFLQPGVGEASPGACSLPPVISVLRSLPRAVVGFCSWFRSFWVTCSGLRCCRSATRAGPR